MNTSVARARENGQASARTHVWTDTRPVGWVGCASALRFGGRRAHTRAPFDWRAHRLFNRSGYTHAEKLPSNAIEARATFDVELYELQRLYMANRGIWEAISSAGPACGIQTTTADVELYIEVLNELLQHLAR